MGSLSQKSTMKLYLAILLLSFSSLTKAGRRLSLIEDNILDLVSTTQEVFESCEGQPGRRCVHFTQCDQDGFIVEDSSQLIDVRFGGDDFQCSEEMEVCCEEREEEQEELDYSNDILGLAVNDTETTTLQPNCPSYFEPWQQKCY